MKNQIHVSLCSEAHFDDPRSQARLRGRAWPGLLLAGCVALLATIAAPTSAAVIEAWVQRYNGSYYIGEARAVAVDGSGDVVVTGFSNSTNGNSDYYTAKYAAMDGALLWEQRYNGPANGFAAGTSLALGSNGMVVTTGSSSDENGGYDYATVVYWENLPPISIALLPTGVRLRFPGVPGRSYHIERAPAVNGPWSTLATSIASLEGLIEYLDTDAPAGSAFYRTTTP